MQLQTDFPRRRANRPIAAAIVAVAMNLAVSGASFSQPAPTFHATCGELRKAIAESGISDAELHTISVEGEISAIGDDGAVVYILVCGPPDPLVLCVTYQKNGSVVGDRVGIGGAYNPKGPDHIMLDPCLHLPADRLAN